MHLGGEGRIRTHGPVNGAPVFKTGAFDRSATSPYFITITNNYIIAQLQVYVKDGDPIKVYEFCCSNPLNNHLLLNQLQIFIHRLLSGRRGRDSNPRAGKTPTYRFSKPAPSASWVPLQKRFAFSYLSRKK